MNQTSPRGTVVVGIDGSQRATSALSWAIDQAVLEHRALTLAHASPSHVAPQTALDVAAAWSARRAPGLEVHRVVRTADPEELLRTLGRTAAMVVVGSHGRGPVRSRLLGSVGLGLAKHPPCPVVVHRPWHPGRVHTGVLVGVDGSPRSLDVVEVGYRMAAQRHLPLRVVHCALEPVTALTAASGWVPPATDPEAERAALAEIVAGLAEKYPEVHARTEVLPGSPSAALVREGARSDALVLGQHHGGLGATLLSGSVTTEVVERASCPVVVVPVS